MPSEMLLILVVLAVCVAVLLHSTGKDLQRLERRIKKVNERISPHK